MRIVKREKQEVSKLFFENNVIILNNNDDIYNKALLMIHKQDYGFDLKSYGLRVCYKNDKYKKTNFYAGSYINKKIDLDNDISSGRYLVITATDLFENYVNTKIYED